MFRTHRTLRRVFALAIAVGALFALPAFASAAPTLTLTSSGSTAPATVRHYSLNFGNPTGVDWSTTSGTISVAANGGTISNVHYTADVTLATTGTTFPLTVTPSAGNGNKSFTITFDVTLPHYYDASYDVTASTLGGDLGGASNTNTTLISAGGPSDIVSTFAGFGPAAGVAGVADQWIVKGGTGTTTANFTNYGTGAASHVLVSVDANGNASYLSPEWAPNPVFNPTASIPANAACVAVSTTECEIPAIAVGQTISVPVTVASLTHFGDVTVNATVEIKDDAGNNYDFTDPTGVSHDSRRTKDVQITDGTTSGVGVAVSAAAHTVAGNTPIAFHVEVVNSGPQPITNGVLQISADSMVSGNETSNTYTDTPSVTASIQGPVAFNGVACTATVNHNMTPNKTYADRYDCPIASLAAGARVTGDVTTKFATVKVDQYGSLDANLYYAGYAPSGSSSSSSDSVNINPSKTVDLQMTTSSQALVGADRVADVTVMVKNAGNTKAEAVTVNGTSNSGNGVFDAANLPFTCTGVTKPMYANCNLGDIAPGATASIVIPVHAGTKLGLLPISFSSSYCNYCQDAGTELNSDDDSSSIGLQIVKANTVPLLGVKIIGKAVAQKMAVVVKKGVKTVVLVPNAAAIKIDLRVNAKTAKVLGIVKKAKRGKKAPAWYVIGTSTTKAKAGGNVTTTTKLSRKYKAKLLKTKKKFVVQRMVTIVSTDPKNAGANALITQNMAFTPAKAKKSKKGKK